MIWPVIVALALFGGGMLTDQSYRDRQIMRGVSQRMEGAARYVDVSVIIKKVVADQSGQELVRGKPLLRVVDERRLGGVVDTQLERPDVILDPPFEPEPLIWYASEAQWNALWHDDDTALAQLIYGSEGAGKTRLLAMWHYRQWIKHLGQGREGGQVAPTLGRLGLVRIEMEAMYRSSWCRYVSRDEFEGFEFCDGTSIRFRYAHQQSAAKGKPIQGYNWSWCGRDEFQDQVEAHEDCESRGREAPGGLYWQLATATGKDDPDWRTLRDHLIEHGGWQKRVLSIFKSPFVWPRFIQDKKKGMDPREFLRRYGNEKTGDVDDIPPERRLYHCWDRELNVRAIPLGAKKITSYVLSRKTNNPRHALLVGHDPGEAKAASVFLDAYDLRGEVLWFVRGELFTLHETAEQHAMQVLSIVRKDFGVNARPDAEIAHVRSQPLGGAEDKPDLHIQSIWKRVGLEMRFAQYTQDGRGCGVIKKDSRIRMVNALLCNAEGTRRLFIEKNDQGKPVAPKLVAAIEMMQRDERGRAEHEEKNIAHDRSDLPAALGYALWPWEKESALALKHDIKKGLG